MLKEKDTRNKLQKTRKTKKTIVKKFYPRVWLLVGHSIKELDKKAEELYHEKIKDGK